MRLLQVNLRSLLLYSLILLIISIPVSFLSVRAILSEEIDESLSLQADQFTHHIQQFEYLDDLETDLGVIDQLSYNVHIKPGAEGPAAREYSTVSFYDSLEGETRPFRQLHTIITVKGKRYDLKVRTSLVDSQDLALAIGSVQVIVSILLTAGLLLINRRLAKRIWKPFYNTLERLRAFELDKSETIPLVESDIFEFNDLNKALSHLTEKSRMVYLNQKEFIENASHELQTPIAIFQSKLDALMQSPNLTQTEAETLMELEATAQRMSRLNKNLLLLSKIDNEQFLEKEPIELAALVQHQVNIQKPVAALHDIGIRTALEPLPLQANKTLLEVLITNLLNNAIRYSAEKEDIVITIHERTFSVSNKGKLLAIDFEKMKERFRKESTHPNSTGLGLAIVKKICDSCGYKMSYNFSNATHTFSIQF
ncbi:sensor histidine kinase [Dawidia soli]|uniref:histidine kinase n=1 Tax=Dawidia soli TaxID=2782352 RepID=A0AAP2D4F2_9BACT|nr:HAMP domain-containing sensor histidine kinase [Dawidia soli]MBT1684962.1 HAMP domain-containing histidine kinase [Dawidia soli]